MIKELFYRRKSRPTAEWFVFVYLNVLNFEIYSFAHITAAVD